MEQSLSPESVAIPVEHPGWSDSLHFIDDLFHRAGSGCTGRFEILPDGCVFLKWDHWKPEILIHTGKIISLDQYSLQKESGPLDLPETWVPVDRSIAKACVVTFSRERLHHVCSLVACMKAQSESNFVHVIHAIAYTGEQYQFLRQMIGDDERFILREAVAMPQKEHLLHVLADARRFNAERYVKIDDDDVYAPTFLATILEQAQDSDFTAGASLFFHSSNGNSSYLSLRNPQFGNNMCLSTEAVDYLLAAPDRPECRFEDSFAHHSLRDAGFKIRTFELEFPEILYLRHSNNTSALAFPVGKPSEIEAQPSYPPGETPPLSGSDSQTSKTIAVCITPTRFGLPHLDAFLRYNPGVPVHVMSLPEVEGQALESAWRGSDARILEWWDKQGRHLDFDHALFLEWDVLFAKPIEEVFPHDAHFQCKEVMKPGKQWFWFKEIVRLPETLREHATGVVPLAVLRISRKCLSDIFDHSLRKELYDNDVFCELRLPTLAAACGYEPQECPDTLPGVAYYPVTPDPGSGVWHAVKQRFSN